MPQIKSRKNKHTRFADQISFKRTKLADVRSRQTTTTEEGGQGAFTETIVNNPGPLGNKIRTVPANLQNLR